VAARPSVQQPNLPSTDTNRIKVPSWDLDPVWSLAPWPVTIQFGSMEVEIPAMNAADWLALLMGKTLTLGEMLDVIPGVDDLLLDQDITIEEINELLTDMITTVSGRQWWITLRLLGVARRHWDTIGPEMITTVDARQVSLAAWMTVLQSALLKSMDPKNVPMFIAQVQAPPSGTEMPAMHREELTAKEFLAMAG
jgi:hypothetical protein